MTTPHTLLADITASDEYSSSWRPEPSSRHAAPPTRQRPIDGRGCHPDVRGDLVDRQRALRHARPATTAGLSGEMIRDMMVSCVEARFGSPRAPHRVQWLSDNGSIYAAAKTIDIALALNLDPCFTPVESPESNGIAEAFVKTFKRDYVRVNPIPDAEAALAAIPFWMDDYNDVHPHSRLGYRSPREYIRAMSQPAACPV